MACDLTLVAVIDDDESVRESLPDLLREAGYAVKAHASAEEFLADADMHRINCLVLDVAMPGMSGPELQLYLAQRNQQIPVVFITARVDEAMRTKLIELGAVDCLFKPFTEADLLTAIATAIRRN